jgi:Tfp pilus assembly protein PilF
MGGNRSIPILLLAAVVACAAWAEAQQSRSVRRHRVPVEPTVVEQAEAALDKQQYAEAEKLLLKAVEAEPADYRAWFNLGYLYTATDRRQEAVHAYRRAVEAKPDVFESNLNLGLLLAAQGQPEAARYLRAATGLKPSAEAEAGLLRAWLALAAVLEEHDPAGAAAALRSAAELQPEDAELRLRIGRLLESAGEVAGAAAEYEAAAEMQPESPQPLGALVDLYVGAGRLPEAAQALERYLKLAPADARARIQLARLAVAAGNREQATTVLQDIERALAPGEHATRRELAALYMELEQFEAAERQYRALLQADGGDGDAHYALGKLLMKQRRYPEAQERLLAAVNLRPGLGEAYGDLAFVAAENKDHMLTLRALEARARLLPENPGTYFLRATAYDHLRAPKEAAENYHKFLAAADGKHPDQEWQARQRLRVLEPRRR